MRQLRQMLLAMLVGLLVTIGGLVAPLLFATLEDRALAGRLAGVMFHAANLLTVALVSAVMVAGGWSGRPRRDRIVLCAPALLLAASEWILHPLIDAEKQLHGTATTAFAVWHGLSSGIYLLATVTAVWALSRELRPAAAVNPAG